MLTASVICSLATAGSPAVHLTFADLEMLNGAHAPLLIDSLERIAKMMIDGGAIQRLPMQAGDWFNAGSRVR